MITPHKHMNLDGSVLRASSLMLREVSKRHTLEIEVLRARLTKKLGSDCAPVFMPALSFLYLLGKIKYHPKTDSVEFRLETT